MCIRKPEDSLTNRKGANDDFKLSFFTKVNFC